MGVNVLQFAYAHQVWDARVRVLYPDGSAEQQARAARESWPMVRVMIALASERNAQWASNPQAVIEEIINGIDVLGEGRRDG